MQNLLTRENIEFYTQRRKQYCEDFLKLTQQFQPKIDRLTKILIARKQVSEDSKINAKKQFQSKKASKVLASLSKSKDIQYKIDKEMLKFECKYQLDELPNCEQEFNLCSFNYSQTCNKIQHAIVPLISNLHTLMKEKQEEIKTDQDNNPDLYKKQDELMKMKEKSKRFRKIMEKLQKMELNQEEKVYRKSIRKLDKFDAAEDFDESLPYSRRHLISKRKIEAQELADKEKARQAQKQFEDERIRESIQEQIQKHNSLDSKIKTHYKKMGLTTRRLESMAHLKEYLNECRSQTNTIVNEVKQRQLQKILTDQRFSITLYSTQMHSQNLTPVACEATGLTAPIINSVNTQKNIINTFQKESKLGFNKIRRRYHNLESRLEKGSNFDFQDNKLILL